MFKKATSIILGAMLLVSPLAVSAQTLPSIPPNASIEQLQMIVVQLTQILQQLLQQLANRGGDTSGRPSVSYLGSTSDASNISMNIAYANIPTNVYAEIALKNVSTGMVISTYDLRQGGTGNAVFKVSRNQVASGVYKLEIQGGSISAQSEKFELSGTAPTCSVTLSGSTLSWTSSGATSATSDLDYATTQAYGSVPVVGSRVVQPTTPTIYSFWFEGPGGKAGCTSPRINAGGAAGSIRVTAPNGGETWEIGKLNTITWEPYRYASEALPSQNPANQVDAYLLRGTCPGAGCESVGKIMDQGKASLHTYFNLDSYSRSATPGQYYVRLYNRVTNTEDISDAPFTLLPRAVDLKVNGRDGDLSVADNQQITVSWTTANYTFPNGCTLYGGRATPGAEQVPLKVASSGSMAYYADMRAGSGSGLHIVCRDGGNGFDHSDFVRLESTGVSQPASSIRVVSPNGGENIDVNSEFKVSANISGLKSISFALYRNDQWLAWLMKDVSTAGYPTSNYEWVHSHTPVSQFLPEIGTGSSAIYKIYATGSKADGTGYIDDKSDAPFSFIAGGTTTQTATYRGYLNGALFITTNNVTESYALENCKLNAANNPTKSIRCTWGEKEIYNAPAIPVGQTNPVVINSFSASSPSVAVGQSVTFKWSSNLSSADLNTYQGGCSIQGITPSNRQVNVTNGFVRSASNSTDFAPTESATYTLFCSSGAKDGSPSAQKTVTVDVSPKPSCSITYSPSTIYAGQKLSVSWAGNVGERTYKLARNGVTYFSSGAIAGSGNATAAYEELGGPGVITRTDTITNSGGSSTCTASVTVAANDRIVSPNALTAGQSISSPSGAFKALYQTDGHFVIYRSNSTVAWSTGRFGVAPGRAVMQSDGNFVNYDASGNAYWSSGTSGRGTAPYALVLQDDGNLVIYDAANSVIWSAAGGIASAATPSESQMASLASALAALEAMLKAILAR